MDANKFGIALAFALKSRNVACRDHGDGVVQFYGTDYNETLAVIQEDGSMLIVVDGDELDEMSDSVVSLNSAVHRIVNAVATL